MKVKHKEKQDEEIARLNGRVNLRVEPALRNLIDELIKESGASDISDYLRGLVIAEAIESKKKMLGISIPAWLVERRVILIKKEN